MKTFLHFCLLEVKESSNFSIKTPVLPAHLNGKISYQNMAQKREFRFFKHSPERAGYTCKPTVLPSHTLEKKVPLDPI